jgi:hypothetical protein
VLATTGQSPTLSADALELFASPVSEAGPLSYFRRLSAGDAFTAAGAIPGLETANLRTPELTADGGCLFASSSQGLVSACRFGPGESFSAPRPALAITLPSGAVFGSPAVSADCSGLYVVAVGYPSAGARSVLRLTGL